MENGFSGLDQMSELMAKLERMGKSIDDATKEKALRAGAEVAREKIVNHPNVPVSNQNHAHAKDNIEIVKITGEQIDIGAINDHFYLLFHEIGAQGGTYKGKDGRDYKTPTIPAKPFMRPAFESNKDEIEQAMAKEIRRGMGL